MVKRTNLDLSEFEFDPKPLFTNSYGQTESLRTIRVETTIGLTLLKGTMVFCRPQTSGRVPTGTVSGDLNETKAISQGQTSVVLLWLEGTPDSRPSNKTREDVGLTDPSVNLLSGDKHKV